MTNIYIGARSPKGNVGVRGVLDSGELSAYSAGVLSGFAGNSVSSWTINVGGVSGVQDTAVSKNPGGESELFGGTAGQSIPFIIGGAPGTPGQSRTDALVVYKDPFFVSTVNDAIDAVGYQVVPGTAAATGSQVPPNEATIRATIPTGTLKFVAVIGYVTIAHGASGVALGNYFKNPALLNTQVVANQTARNLIIPTEGMKLFQLDNDMEQVWDGSAWRNVPRVLKRVQLTSAGDTIDLSGIPARDVLEVNFKLIPSGQLSARFRFNGVGGTSYSWNVRFNGGGSSIANSQPVLILNNAAGTHWMAGSFKVDNSNTNSKRVHGGECVYQASEASASSPDVFEFAGTYASNTQVTQIEFLNSGTGDFAINSYAEVIG